MTFPRSLLALAVLTVVGIPAFSDPPSARIETFIPRQGGTTEVWRITNDPARRDWANYQNTDAWSPDGRYICYEGGGGVHLYDFYKGRDIEVDRGAAPRWATGENWLFYLRRAEKGPGSDVIWLTADTGRKTRLCGGITGIGETDSEDRWLFGKTAGGIVRIPIRENARPEDISAGGAMGSFMLPNPRHPRVMFRGDSKGPDGRDLPYAPTRVWSDLEGNNVVSASPMIQRCHQAWTGDGLYHMHGNTQLRGRRWDEPFPSNLHYLANVFVNDPCACGRSGRWAIGSGNVGPMPVADLRSGDGRIFLLGLSWLHDSRTFSYSSGSGLHDNDAKGSPDGTKVVLSSTYDLTDGPVTTVAAAVPGRSADVIRVVSTDGFPRSGRLSVNNEVIGYERRTATTFEGLTREMYGTIPVTGSLLEDMRPWRRAVHITRPDNNVQLDALRPDSIIEYANNLHFIASGDIVTSFDHRLVPGDMRDENLLPSRYKRPDRSGNTADMNSPLVWQRQTDVYVAVIRKPDRPCLARPGGALELIPGENHYETRGYLLYRNGRALTEHPLEPGSVFTVPDDGDYSAAAVEWSGLTSGLCPAVSCAKGEKLFVRADKPADFQWTHDRWEVEGGDVSEKRAMAAERAVREIVHRTDGVIRREWYNWGRIVERHDLNAGGKATRRLYYRGGVLERREYFSGDGRLVSRELFAPDGYITESMRFAYLDGEPREITHWWFEKGLPVKLIGSEGHTLVSLPGIYEKAGDDWVWKPLDTGPFRPDGE